MNADDLVVTRRCPECNSWMQVRKNRRTGDKFLGCMEFPSCDFTIPYDRTLTDLGGEIDRLRREIHYLTSRIEDLEAAHSIHIEGRAREVVEGMIFLFHPDRNQQGCDPHEVTVRLLALREIIDNEN